VSAIFVEVTAEHIAAAGQPPADDVFVPIDALTDPVERAIAALTGQKVICDEDEPEGHEIATIGQGATTLVVDLPPEQFEWINRWYARQPVEPFTFRIEIERWLVDLISRAAGSPTTSATADRAAPRSCGA
jgi:hypothetical protein